MRHRDGSGCPVCIMSGIGYYASPIGVLEITSHGSKITGLHYLESQRSEPRLTPVIEQCITELNDYFTRGRKFFNVELQISGSSFQNKVWNELLAIPYGKTISYLDLAIRVGDVNSIRAVGMANGENPLPILVPCHRVIGKNGDLVGYSGGLEKKIWLLEHEGAFAEQLKLF